MKKNLLIAIALLASFVAAAQSTNPLNYSGRMYVEAIEIIQTPRYISYEDHAILSQQMRIPSTQIMKFELDFEKGVVKVDNKEMRVKVNDTKKYNTDHGWVVVIYTDLVDEGDKGELVWPEFGKPYFQQITKADSGVNIARMVLTSKPYVTDEGEALMNLLQGLGTM